MGSLSSRFFPEGGEIVCTQVTPSPTSEGPSLAASREYQGQRGRSRHSLLAIANYSNSWQINTWTEEFFTDACFSFGPSSAPVWCSLHDLFEEPLTNVRLVSRLVIAIDRSIVMFWKAKTSVFPHQKISFPLTFKIWNWHGLRTLADVRYFIWKWTEIFLEA